MNLFPVLTEQILLWNISVSEALSILKDAATVFIIIAGFFLGRKGIREYLLKDIIKERVARVHASNEKTKILTKKIINSIRNIENIQESVTDDEIEKITNLTNDLVDSTSESSSQVETLAFLLQQTMKNVRPKIVREGVRYEIRLLRDYYSIITNVCYKINSFSSRIIDIPKSKKLVKYHEIRPEIRKYLHNSGFETLKNYNSGLDLHPNSATPMIFFSILRKSTEDYIFYRKYFLTLKNNNFLLYNLLVNKIYFPLVLEKKEADSLFIKTGALHLINFQSKKTFAGRNAGREFYIFTYSNLNQFVNFVDKIKEVNLQEDYFDTFLDYQNKHF